MGAAASTLSLLGNKVYSLLSAVVAAASIGNTQGGVGEFSTDENPTIRILPLLSLLPDHIAHDPIPSTLNPPLTTESRMPDIDPASLSLHKSLHSFTPLTSCYARASYADAFNWADLRLPEDEEREWYCVVFRSQRKPGSDCGSLYEADRLAHEEAVQNGGLIMYWYGVPDSEGYNLATCIWQSRRHAIAANSGPHHVVAVQIAAASFESFVLERYVLRKVAGDTGVSVHEYTGGDVGW